MKEFAVKTGVFVITLFLFAFILQYSVDRGLKRDKTGDYKEWNEIINSHINADLIIQGSSRAMEHFSPFILDSTFNFNSFNLGMMGYHFHMEYYRFLLYLKYNKKPKYIIQNVDHRELGLDLDLYNYAQFLPYLNSDIIKEAVSGYNGLNWGDIYIPMFKYRGNFKLPIQGFMSNFHEQFDDLGKYKGFEDVHKHWDSSFREYKKANPLGRRCVVDSGTVALYKKYLDLCKAEKINVIMVYSPEYFEARDLCINGDSIINIFKNISSVYNIPFLDYSNDSICYDTANFYNSQHLNSTGTRKFDLKLVNDLKKIIK